MKIAHITATDIVWDTNKKHLPTHAELEAELNDEDFANPEVLQEAAEHAFFEWAAETHGYCIQDCVIGYALPI